MLVDHIDELRDALREVKSRHPFRIDAMVVMPNHLHALWTLPPGDANYPLRWSLIKSGFSRRLPKTERRNPSREEKGERGIWQRRYWEHWVRNERDFERHVEYIHYNPVKHGFVKCPADWPWSSIHRYIREGILSADWGADIWVVDDPGSSYGEPAPP